MKKAIGPIFFMFGDHSFVFKFDILEITNRQQITVAIAHCQSARLRFRRSAVLTPAEHVVYISGTLVEDEETLVKSLHSGDPDVIGLEYRPWMKT